MQSTSHKSTFLKLFPLPDYLSLPAAGVDVSDSTIKFIEFDHTRSGLVITKYGSQPVPEGAVVDGNVKDPEKLAEAFKRLRKKYGLTFVHVSLPEEQAYLFETTVPNVPPREMRSAVSFGLEQHVPIDSGEAVFDFDVLPESATAGSHSVVVSVFPKQKLMEYLEPLHDAGLIPLSYEIEAQAIARAVIPHTDRDTHMIIDFGKNRTGISIVSDDLIRFTSTVAVRGAMVTKAIHKHYPNYSPEEIVSFKNKHGLAQGENEDLTIDLSGVAALLKDEIRKHILYWHTHKGSNEHNSHIQSIILCGGDSNLNGLPEYLSGALGIEARRAQVWQNVFSFDTHIPPISFQQSLGFASAIGLALH